MSTSTPVPVAAQRLIGFLNTREHARREDTLAGDDPGELRRLRELRAVLYVLAHDEQEPGTHERAWTAVNALAATVPTTVRFAGADASSVEAAGPDARLGALLADLHAAVNAGQWGRVRMCAFAPCDHAFYDQTRSRTQRWHDYATCGNRVNVRAHRGRAAAGRSPRPGGPPSPDCQRW
jgi:predicted RNA-binding Zn ribbon-like protein